MLDFCFGPLNVFQVIISVGKSYFYRVTFLGKGSWNGYYTKLGFVAGSGHIARSMCSTLMPYGPGNSGFLLLHVLTQGGSEKILRDYMHTSCYDGKVWRFPIATNNCLFWNLISFHFHRFELCVVHFQTLTCTQEFTVQPSISRRLCLKSTLVPTVPGDIPRNIRINAEGRAAACESHPCDVVMLLKRFASDEFLIQDSVFKKETAWQTWGLAVANTHGLVFEDGWFFRQLIDQHNCAF